MLFAGNPTKQIYHKFYSILKKKIFVDHDEYDFLNILDKFVITGD
jgi:hypothetical protein